MIGLSARAHSGGGICEGGIISKSYQEFVMVDVGVVNVQTLIHVKIMHML